jgi:hypothetical protein
MRIIFSWKKIIIMWHFNFLNEKSVFLNISNYQIIKKITQILHSVLVGGQLEYRRMLKQFYFHILFIIKFVLNDLMSDRHLLTTKFG